MNKEVLVLVITKSELARVLESQVQMLNTKCRLRKFIPGVFITISQEIDKFGEISFFVKDKDGNLIELFEWQDIVEPIPNGFWRNLFCLPQKTKTMHKLVDKKDTVSNAIRQFITHYDYSAFETSTKVYIIYGTDETMSFINVENFLPNGLIEFNNGLIAFDNLSNEFILNEKSFKKNETLIKEIEKHLKKENKIVVQTCEHYLVVKND